MQTFDATKVINNLPWYERALETVAPGWALKRLEARVQKELFSYNASATNRLYAPRTYGQPSESTMTSRSRVVMMWEARDLVENTPQAREVSRKFGHYLTPVEYSPTTEDRGYNGLVSEFFHQWCKTCDISGRHSFRKLVQLAAEERPVDGDCGFAIRRADGGLKVQLVPATRIGNPNAIGAESDHYFQGVIVDDFGKPTAYRIYRVTREGVYFDAEEISSANFCHYFDPFRIDQYRGITDFHAAIRTTRMLYEILEAEKAGVRFASQQAALVFTDNGTATPRNLFQPSPAVTLPSGQQQKNELSEVGQIKYLGSADKVEVMPSRPSQAFTGFVQHLMHEIAIGVGIPEGVLFGTQDYKGPSVRAEFAAADRVFTRHQGILTDKVLDPIKNAVILDAIAREELPPPPLKAGESMVQALKRATRGEWRFPPKLTIDIGRESAANMAENRQGAKSLQEIASEQGTDAFARLEQIAIEANYVKELAQKYEIPESAIRLVTNTLPTTPAAAAAVGDNVAAAASDAQAAAVQGPAETQGDVPQQNAANIETPGINPGDEPPEMLGSKVVVEMNFSDGTYIPSREMAASAQRALRVRENKSPAERGLTALNLSIAKAIAAREPISEACVRRIAAFFARTELDAAGTPWRTQDRTWQAWHGFGGKAGKHWSEMIVSRLNRDARTNSNSSAAFERITLGSAVAAPLSAEQSSDIDAWLDAAKSASDRRRGNESAN